MNPDKNENHANSQSTPFPEFDLGTPLTAIPVEEREIPKQRETKLSLALLFIVLAMVLVGTLQHRGGAIDKLATRADSISDAIRDFKIAFAQKQQLLYSESRLHRKQMGTRAQERALGALQELAVSEEASPGDLRRYAIAIGALENPQSLEILRTLRRLAKLKPRIQTSRTPKEAAREMLDGKLVLSPAQEIAMWEQVYGGENRLLSRQEVPVLRMQIAGLHLGWFEGLALERVYARAGMNLERDATLKHALSSANTLASLVFFQYGLGFFGILVWIVVLARYNRKNLLHSSLSSLPTSQQGVRLTYSNRVMTFALYLVLPLLLSLFSPLLQGAIRHPSPIVAIRLNAVIYLLESAFIIVCCSLCLKRLFARENGSEEVSWRCLVSQIGFHAPQPLSLVTMGAKAYGFILSPLLFAALLSNWIFQGFKTAAHPLSLSFMLVQSVWDWGLIFLQIAVVAPLVEEMLFRGVLYPALRERWGVWGGIALTSAIFAILHPNMPAGFLPLFVLGAGMAILYEKSRSLLPAMVLHAINNGYIFLLQVMIMAN